MDRENNNNHNKNDLEPQERGSHDDKRQRVAPPAADQPQQQQGTAAAPAAAQPFHAGILQELILQHLLQQQQEQQELHDRQQQQQQQQQQQAWNVLGALPPELAAAIVYQAMASQQQGQQQQVQSTAQNTGQLNNLAMALLVSNAIQAILHNNIPQQHLSQQSHSQPATRTGNVPCASVSDNASNTTSFHPQFLQDAAALVGSTSTSVSCATSTTPPALPSTDGAARGTMDENAAAFLAGIRQLMQQQHQHQQPGNNPADTQQPQHALLQDSNPVGHLLSQRQTYPNVMPSPQQHADSASGDQNQRVHQLAVASAWQAQQPVLEHTVGASPPTSTNNKASGRSCTSTSSDNGTPGKFMSLGIDEDPNWLSEYQCFVRMEFMEVFQAEQQHVQVRSNGKKVILHQVGIRCAFCPASHKTNKAARSSAFPSSIRQIYQSFAMMLRDHFDKCQMIPTEKLDKYHRLKGRGSQGASDSKNYWEYAAQKLGLVDTEDGICLTEQSRAEAARMPSFRSAASADQPQHVALAASITGGPPKRLVEPDDRALITPYLYELLSQLQLIHLLPGEQVAKRKHLPVGLEGIGCIRCARVGRLGFSRCFPLRRHLLPVNVVGMHNHLQRCTLCPSDIQENLEEMRLSVQRQPGEPTKEHAFYDRLWGRLNRKEDINA